MPSLVLLDVRELFKGLVTILTLVFTNVVVDQHVLC